MNQTESRDKKRELCAELPVRDLALVYDSGFPFSLVIENGHITRILYKEGSAEIGNSNG